MALTKAQQQIVADAAYRLGIPRAFALGVVDKESAGRAFWSVKGVKLPSIRIEGHYFYKYLPKDKRADAVRLGLASPKAGVVKNPGTMSARYAMLDRMAEIDIEAAYKSISIGIGQVMGTWAQRLGYNSVVYAVSMFQSACVSFDNQVLQFLSFIATDKQCLKAAQDYDFKTFARIYNGPNYKKNNYDTELAAYVLAYRDGDGRVSHDYTGRVVALGYKDVKDFQHQKGLVVDGLVGDITRGAIIEAEAAAKKAKDKGTNNAIVVGAGSATVVAGGAVAENPDAIMGTVETVKQAVDAVKPIVEPAVPVLLPIIASLPKVLVLLGCIAAIGVAGYIIWRVYQSYQTKEVAP